MNNRVLLIQAGSPPAEIMETHGDLVNWFSSALSSLNTSIDVVAPFKGETLPTPNQHKVAIITGSWSMVTDQLDWSERTADWIRSAVSQNMPIFGVCFGHQLMSYALGGKVGFHPQGREVGSQRISLTDQAKEDPLLKCVDGPFWAHLTHLQSVLEEPEDAIVLGYSQHDSKQIIRYSDSAISTQFHPEMTLEIASSLIDFREAVLSSEGFDISFLKQQLRTAPIANQLFLSFIAQYLTH